MLHEKTIEYITGLPDERLVEYALVGTRMYEPEAVAFAQKELERRQIAPERQAAIRQPMISQLAQYDAQASIDRVPRPASAILCEGCGLEVPNMYVEYHQNVGAVVLRFSYRYKGCLCKRCNQRYFWKSTLTTLLLGWWGFVSFFIALAFLLQNIVTYLGTWKLAPVPRYAGRPHYDDDVIAKLTPHVATITQRLGAGDNVENIAREVAADADLTPGQVLYFVRDVLHQPRNQVMGNAPIGL